MPNECRTRAEQCLIAAQRAEDPQTRGLFLRLAVQWIQMAEWVNVYERARGRPAESDP